MDKDNNSAACFLSPSSFWIPDWIPVSSAWYEHGPFAFWVTEVHRPRCVVELGCHWGFSYMAFCQSVQRNQINAKCYAVDTWKGDEHAGEYGEEVYSAVSVYNQKHYPEFSSLIRSSFDQALDYFPDGSIDLLHIDGLHTYEAVKHDFENWRPKISGRGIVLFHDTNVRERNFGVGRFWRELADKHPHFEFLHGHGLGILGIGKELPLEVLNLFAVEENSVTAGNIRSSYARLGGAVVQDVRISSEVHRLQQCLMATSESLRQQEAESGERMHQLESELRQLTTLSGERIRQLESELRRQTTQSDERIRQLQIENQRQAVQAEERSRQLEQEIIQQANRHAAELLKKEKKASQWESRHGLLERQRAEEIQRLEAELSAKQLETDGLRDKSRMLAEAVESAELWQRSWFKRAFYRWHPPVADGRKHGFFRRFGRSIRKRRRWLVNHVLKSFVFSKGAPLHVSNPTRDQREEHLTSRVEKQYDNNHSTTYRPDTRERVTRYEAWQEMNIFRPSDARELRRSLRKRQGRLPKISFITPVYNTSPIWLRSLVNSLLDQIYENWELVLADDSSPLPQVKSMLVEMGRLDERIRVVSRNCNGGISEATNTAVETATGDIVAFLDHDDLVTPDCAAELAIYYSDHPEADMVYSDDDKIDLNGKRYAPQFKPDWSPILLLSYMYLSHIISVKRSLFLELGGFRKEFDGSQDYDFALRVAEIARHVGHIPKILYHWRSVHGSTASSGDAKPASFEAGRRAVEAALRSRQIRHTGVSHPQWAKSGKCGIFEIEFPDTGPTVTIIVPTKNQLQLLKACVKSLRSTTYQNYRVLIIDNDSDDLATLDYLRTISTSGAVQVVRIPNEAGTFNFAALMNKASLLTTDDYILFLNNDTRIINKTWLSQMMGFAQMRGVGAVGAKLYFVDDTIQHAGIVHGYNPGLVGHAFRHTPSSEWGYMGFLKVTREYSGVTAACMLTPRVLFHELGGFNEIDFAVAYNDVDYCYRLVSRGYSCIYCSSAELYHHEGKSRGFKDNPAELKNLRRKYTELRDKWYNPNLSLDNEGFEVYPSRQRICTDTPISVLFVSHNLNREGATGMLLDVVLALVQKGIVRATVLSPTDGPHRSQYENAGVQVSIIRDPLGDNMNSTAQTKQHFTTLSSRFYEKGAQVVVANTLLSFWAVAAADEAGIPALWCQHESEPWQTYFDYLPLHLKTLAYSMFNQAFRVIYSSDATRSTWSPLNSRGNFEVIRDAIPKERLRILLNRWSYESARNHLGINNEEVVATLVGTICPRKGQTDIIQAFKYLSSSIYKKLRVFVVGCSADYDYSRLIETLMKQLPREAAGRISFPGETPDPFLYYRASDIFVCTSRIESAPRVVSEAMACGLPIVTTPVYGVPEMVREGVNALFYNPGDIDTLATHLSLLVDDPELRSRFAAHSPDVLGGLPNFDDTVNTYARVIQEAAMLYNVKQGTRPLDVAGAQPAPRFA